MKIFGFTINANHIVKNLNTLNFVVRRNKKLVLLVGTSAGKDVKRKFFVRTELFEGLRLSVGKIRDEIRSTRKTKRTARARYAPVARV